jgi:predicted Fe-Mo cluster-binding NifX family protein
MKIVVTATGTDRSSNVDLRFGRAKYFLVVATDTNHSEAHDNLQNLNAAQGAGIQAAEAVARLGAEAVITGNVGPKAFRALSAAGIKVYLSGPTSVEEAIRQFKAGELKLSSAANVQGHWA